MPAIRLRAVPWSDLTSFVSDERSTTTRLPPSILTLISGRKAHESLPAGPSTWTTEPARLTFTLSGTSIGFLPSRDMSSPHPADEFAADVQLLRLAAAEDPAGRREHRHAQAVEHLRDLRGAAEDAPARRGDPLDVRQDPAVLRVVLQVQPHRLAVRLLLVDDDLDVGEVPLGLEDLGDALLQLRMGHGRFRMAALVRVLEDREHVADGV